MHIGSVVLLFFKILSNISYTVKGKGKSVPLQARGAQRVLGS